METAYSSKRVFPQHPFLVMADDRGQEGLLFSCLDGLILVYNDGVLVPLKGDDFFVENRKWMMLASTKK
jgi:hypothetical protein